jgi:CMP-N-acetylneuraminic acid synthetase/quercetin dioxygenase-like cupin family protein
MPKIVAMIPARLGSKRIKSKNLRLLAGKPLVCHVADKCKEAQVFDGIYINSEADIFKDIAEEYGIKFYKRPAEFAADDATNDMFAFDFMKHIKCDILIQVNPTSPLITVDDIKAFVKKMVDEKLDTLHSVKLEQIEGVYNGKPLNFDPKKPMPRSQDLKPIMIFSSGIMGWRVENYSENMKKLDCATYGGNGKIGYFVLSGFSTIDIDNEEDFQLAELAIEYQKQEKQKNIEYYEPHKKIHVESDVPSILKKDGVDKNDLFDANKKLINLEQLIKESPKNTSWSKRIINTENNSATLICQMPGEGNRRHYHADWNEWWYIVDGTWEWEIEGKTTNVSKGDVVFIQKGKLHKITAIGDKPAIRLAVSREDVGHIYPEDV